MRKYVPAAVAVLAVLALAFSLRLPRNADAFDVVAFGSLPVLVNGRVKPLDTVARTSLLLLQGRQRVSTAEGNLAPVTWLLDVIYRPEMSDTYQTFEIAHPDLLTLLNLAPAAGAGGKRFSARQMAGHLGELDRQAKLAEGTDAAARTPFQRAVVQLRNGVMLYQQLQSTVLAPGTDNFLGQLAQLEQALVLNPSPPQAGDEPDAAESKLRREMGTAFLTLQRFRYLQPVPPGAGDTKGWNSFSGAWSAALVSGQVDPVLRAYSAMGRAWRERQPDTFNVVVRSQRERFAQQMPDAMRKVSVEIRFNSAQPFYSSAVLYVLGLLVALVSWLRWPEALVLVARTLVEIAFSVATLGILCRMWLEARPPVTNLYSSALFVGWGAVALCLVLERLYRNGIGSAAGGATGFATLLIAHHLALGGDTLEMMRAVLDSNFWLATHVVTIAIGYSATFLAGLLAVIYVVRGALTRTLDHATAANLGRMTYGVVCFATLFSFVGTILGGIWADQSWGRFWGWDPKENGALLIVIWNAILLHARWGGYVQTRGLAVLAIFGNVVTAWSWFGVNMLGVGLHSYGFMDAAFWWLVGFAWSQLALMGMAAIPSRAWRSAALMNRGMSVRA